MLIEFVDIIKSLIGELNFNPIYVMGPLGFFISIYISFKSNKRLVFTISSTDVDILKEDQKIQGKLKLVKDKLTKSIFTLYNNGKKSINKEDLSRLILDANNGQIINFKVLDFHKRLSKVNLGNLLEIQIDEFDKAEYFTIQIIHTDQLQFKGRVKDSGNIMNTETKSWLIMNFIFVILIFLVSGYFLIYHFDEHNERSWAWMLFFTLILIIVSWLTRTIHSWFFIPDKITSKHIKEK